jgi:CHASE2 domain-containing sensor protein
VEDITLVSIDACKGRLEIAGVIEQIASLNPKVIGLDVFFRNPMDPKPDSILENVIANCENLVTVCELRDERRESRDEYNTSVHNIFGRREPEGFVNLDGDGSSTVRTFTPRLFLKKEQTMDTVYCFAAQVARLCSETAFQEMLDRKGNSELINFRPLSFGEIDKNEIAENTALITGKTVLIGSLKVDAHKTPVSPEMHGMEVHAYIISTILEGKYIDRVDNIWTKLMNILLCYLFALFCWIATTRVKKGAGILIKLLQVGILFLAFFAGRYFFDHYNMDITYTQTIIVMGVLILIVDAYNVCLIWGGKWIFKHNKISQNEKK